MRRALRLLALVACATCREPVTPSVVRVPASLQVVSSPAAAVTVGAMAGLVSVRVLDVDGDAMSGILVTFAVSRGAGQLGTVSMRSDSAGIASSTYRAGTIVASNEVSVYVSGLTATKFVIATTAGAPRTFTFGQRSLKYTPTADSLLATATARDTFLNATGAAVAWAARNPALVSVTSAGSSSAVVRVLSRPGTTYVVATSGTATDSLLVVAQDSSSTPCTFLATPPAVTLPIGGTLQFDTGMTCVSPTAAGAEYAVVAHLNTGAYPVAQSFEVTPDGVIAPVGPFPPAPPPAAAQAAPLIRDFGFEQRMRAQEGREIGPRAASARAAMASRARQQGTSIGAANIASASAKVGDILSVNVNALDFCSAPDLRQGRVAAVSKTAVILTDVDNPSGGFGDDEYRTFATEMDTLVFPVDTTSFGSPTDIDGNRRVAIFFTRAVNELTAPGSPGGVVLGFYYLRDLLPRQSSFGDCPGSNVGELLYLLVPDPTASVNGNARSKDYVAASIIGTIAHEYQHLISASRRMYVTDALRVDEDVWLSEGLSHIAEELVFYRASGLASRSNIGGGQLLAGSTARTAFDNYQASNFGRYRQFMLSAESSSPLAGDDFLATRGATWAFLRYLVDRIQPDDDLFWRKLVNSRWSGTVNLDSALAGSGVTVLGALRDWTTAVLMDDIAPAAATALQQKSWDFRTAFPGAYGQAFALGSRVLFNGLTSAVGIVGGGTSYLRFGVAQNKEALIRVTAQGGGPLPAGMRLTLVRIK